jgi:hypothetical protein
MQDIIAYIIVAACVIWAGNMLYRRLKTNAVDKCKGCAVRAACQGVKTFNNTPDCPRTDLKSQKNSTHSSK